MRLTLSMRLLRLIMIIIPSIVLIVGCGEGSGKEVIEGTPSPAITGVLLDAPLAGVEWENSGGDLSGVTNASGEFQYRQFETVTFKIGGIVLGTAAGAPFVTPVELTGSTNPTDQAAVNQFVLLQSLDEDGDASNGIVISDATRTRAAGTSIDFKATNFGTLVAAVVAAVGEPGSTVVSESDALQHFFETYLSMGGESVLGFPFPGFASSDFTLVFSDEFNTGTAPSPSKWTVETGYGPNNDGWGNNEWQLYTNSADNVRVEGGNLVLSAQCPTPPCGVRDGTVTSG
ncbi:MAG: hypothetical protein HKN70_03790, partial [Gammaproteobacteria bacterium]|nr:hypothetical protein [Gammaproteobacteria bacterium]